MTTKRPFTWVVYPVEPQQTSANLSEAITSLRREFHVFGLADGCIGIDDPGGRLTQARLDKIRLFVRAIAQEIRKESA